MDYWKWMISPDCSLIVTKGSALLTFAMKMGPKPSSSWWKWNVRPVGYRLETLPNCTPLAWFKCPEVSKVEGVPATAEAVKREGSSVPYLWASSGLFAAVGTRRSHYFANKTRKEISPQARSHCWEFCAFIPCGIVLIYYEWPRLPSERAAYCCAHHTVIAESYALLGADA